MPTISEKFVNVCTTLSHREAMRVKTSMGWRIVRYDELLEQSSKVASWLMLKGFKPQDRVVILLENSPLWPVVYFGVLLAGGTNVPLDTHSNSADVAVFIKDADARFVFIENKLVSAHEFSPGKVIIAAERDKKRPLFSLEEIMEVTVAAERSSLPPCKEDDAASLIYTSGTTSSPKGIELSHKNLYANFSSIESLQVCSSKDIFVSILPLFHAYAFMATLLYPFFIGAKIVYPRTLKSTELLPIIKENNVTVMVCVPELLYGIHKSIVEKIKARPLALVWLLKAATELAWWIRKKSKANIAKIFYGSAHEKFGDDLKYFITGGARFDPEVAQNFEKFGFSVLEGYGLTEASPIVSLNLPGQRKIGSVGKVVTGVEVKIANPDKEGLGEILVRGSNVMKGYYKKIKETQEAVKDGWLYTGDLGFVDKDGYLYIRGRTKEMIVLRSGKNIFPEEIEKYYGNTPFIKELGVFLDGSQELLKAVVVPDFEAFKRSGQINIQEKIKWEMENVSKGLPPYKRIMGFTLSKEELPKTRLGKIKRFYLPEIHKRQVSEAKPKILTEADKEKNRILRTPTGQRVVEFLKKELKLKQEINAADHLELDLGIDSLARVELVAGLEKLFQIRLEDEMIGEVATVSDLVSRVGQAVFQAGPLEFVEESPRASWAKILREIDEKDFENINLSGDFLAEMSGSFVKFLVWLVFKVFFRFKVIGKENLSAQGPYIFCCNHSSYLDPFAVCVALPDEILTQTYFIGLRDILHHPSIRWAMGFARLIAIDPGVELIKSMQAASFILKNEKILCIFPEGQRSIDGEVIQFKKGIGILAKELGVRVIPVAIEGTHQAWPRTERFPKVHPIKIIFGKPTDMQTILKEMGAGESEDEYEYISNRLRKEVISLKDEIRALKEKPRKYRAQALQESKRDI